MAEKPVPPEAYTLDYYLERCGGVEFFDRYQEKVLKPVMQSAVKAAKLTGGEKILDLGCGRGELTGHLAARGFDATGVDYSADAIALAEKQFPGVRFLCARVDRLPFADKSFDRIFFLGTVEHLTAGEIAGALAQGKKYLKDEGMMVVTTCTNKLYYKTWSFKLRDAAARAFGLARPRPPRSDEDLALHINEADYFSLARMARDNGWRAEVKAMGNFKLHLADLYGGEVPEGFPLKAFPSWKRVLAKAALALFPLNLLFARSYLCLLRKPA